MLGSTKYTKGVDVWAVGTILGEMFTGRPVFPGMSVGMDMGMGIGVTICLIFYPSALLRYLSYEPSRESDGGSRDSTKRRLDRV